MGKAGPEGKQSLKAWINGLNSHALAHPPPYVFTHINYPQGPTPFFTASLELMKKQILQIQGIKTLGFHSGPFHLATNSSSGPTPGFQKEDK